MAKKQKKHRKPKTTIPVAVVLGMAPLAGSAIRGYNQGSETDQEWRGVWKESLYALTGIDVDNEPHFNPSFMINGTIPILAGLGVHKLFNALGINRQLARMGVPYLRI